MTTPGGWGRRTLFHGGCVLALLIISPALAQSPASPAPGQGQATPGDTQTRTNTDLQDALRAYSQGNYGAAIRLWGPLAQRGDPIAQYNIGRMYARGEGVGRDYAEAYKWFTLSAVAGRREGDQARHAIARSMTPVQMAEGLRRAEAWRRQQR